MPATDQSPSAPGKPESTGPVVVGIGASAGGLKALREFFARVPEDSGLSFVVVVHLSPDHESHLPDLLQPNVRIPVQQVTGDTPLDRNRVYVIPPGRNLSAIDSHLRVSSLEERRIERAPIDHFFRTLARTHDGHAIGVILTGTGSDGSLGLKAIKEKGGLTIVQDPNEAEYDGMPQSAIATGLVDLVLPLHEIPDAIFRFVSTEPRIVVPEDGEEIEEQTSQLLQKAFAQIRARTGRDFSRYKRSTILRRITRRMQMQQLEELPAYLQLLREEPHEVTTLADDLLITVTSFFREPEVYESLKQHVVPALFADKAAGEDLRVWTVGCATGEEAYSMAMLLLEECDGREDVPRLQVFASDLHHASLHKAREGFYPGDIATDVSAERLKRFFTKEDGGYRIKKEVRETVVFAPHNLLADPPFSRIDLISCRNVLIYLQRDAQRDVIDLFHYALVPDGCLQLGSSETIEGHDLFLLENKKTCLYRKRNVPAPEPRLPVFPVRGLRLQGERRHRQGEPLAYGALHQRMVERYGPPSLLLSPDDKIVHLSERAGAYLLHPGGEVTASILKLVRDELRIELREALVAARERRQPVRSKPVTMQLHGSEHAVVLDVRPAREPQQDGFVLVLFDQDSAGPPVAPAADQAPAQGEQSERVRMLESELDLGRQRLQAIIEEYETSQEEMKASNEELQSTNEELRSTMEELETSKEELQSMNEELQTVNQENRHKVEELALLSGDLQNLLGASDIATLFLDRELRIMRFTPRASELFNVRTTDRGRPISDITHRLGYDELRSDAEAVLARLVPVEREVQDELGRWYLTRVLPYRSVEDRIQGVVITFVDISQRKRVEETLRQSDGRKEEFLATLAHELRNPLAAMSNGLALLEIAGGEPRLLDSTREMMQRQMHQLARLVEDLLDVSRINRGKLLIHQTRTELAPVIRQALETVQRATANRQVDVVLPHEPVWLDADPVRLAQVFSNLLINACHFTDAGGHIRLEVERRHGEVLVSVQDDGVGIQTDKLSGLFEMFHQLNRNEDRSREGMGIGLSLVKRLVEMHGGTVAARSEGSGKGSTFLVRLPVVEHGERPVPARPPAVPARLTGLSVLVVDDNRDVADSLSQLLQKWANDVRVVHDGQEAVRAAETFRPDLVLLDVGLPEIDGYEAARRIRQHPWGRAMILVAVTGWGQDVDRQRSAASGFDGHLVKPVDTEDLERLVAKLRLDRQRDRSLTE